MWREREEGQYKCTDIKWEWSLELGGLVTQRFKGVPTREQCCLAERQCLR